MFVHNGPGLHIDHDGFDQPCGTMQVDPLYAAIFVGSMFFPALATIFKERIFASAKKRLNGQTLDLFVVNSFGSAAQALFVFLMLPLVSSMRGILVSQLPNYVKEGEINSLLPYCHTICSLYLVHANLQSKCDLSAASVGMGSAYSRQ